MDPDCAICSSPATAQCDCETRGLDLAIRQAEQRMLSSVLNDTRAWVRSHAQDYILAYFSVLCERRKNHHRDNLVRITERASYYQRRPRPSEVDAEHAELKRGIDDDWKASVQRYPEALEYFYSLVEFNMPPDEDPSVMDPPLSALTATRGTTRPRRKTKSYGDLAPRIAEAVLEEGSLKEKKKEQSNQQQSLTQKFPLAAEIVAGPEPETGKASSSREVESPAISRETNTETAHTEETKVENELSSVIEQLKSDNRKLQEMLDKYQAAIISSAPSKGDEIQNHSLAAAWASQLENQFEPIPIDDMFSVRGSIATTRPSEPIGSVFSQSRRPSVSSVSSQDSMISKPLAVEHKPSTTTPEHLTIATVVLTELRAPFSCMIENRNIKFTPSSLVSAPDILDHLKGIVELFARYPVIWYPLRPRKLLCLEGHVRVSWDCLDCGSQMSVDVPVKQAQEYLKNHTVPGKKPEGQTLAPSRKSILPIHNSASKATSFSTAIPTQNVVTPNATRNPPQESKASNHGPLAVQHTKQKGIIADESKGRYLHWCVNANRFDTRLFHLEIPTINDVRIIQELKACYQTVKGFRSWFSLTDCYGVKFIVFERTHRIEELVACGNEELPARDNVEYSYTYIDPLELFTKTLEKSLVHHFHHPSKCCSRDIEDIMSRVPKKINGRLKNAYGTRGYGMQAIPGWAAWKLCLAIILSQIPSTIFAIRWLIGHPDDLQNAFIFSCYSVGLLNLIVIVPDVWAMQR